MKMNALIYDCEIINLVPPKDKSEQRIPGVTYCEGWGDRIGMGISVVAAYDCLEGSYRVFMKDNLQELAGLMADRKMLVGFNNIGFDTPLIEAHTKIRIPAFKSYDMMLELSRAAGPNVRWSKLNDVCVLNFGEGYAKKVDGKDAPVLWQRGEIGKVVDYAVDDIRCSVRLFEQIMTGQVKCVKTGRMLTLRKPEIAG